MMGCTNSLNKGPKVTSSSTIYAAGGETSPVFVYKNGKPSSFILSSSHLYYRNTQFLFWQCHLT